MSLGKEREVMRSEVVEVTPDLAAKWLEKNRINRILLQQVVDRYATSMRMGLWPLSPQAIIFDTDGNLLNGQHRLWAVILSGVTVKFYVTYGAEPESILVMDENAPRHAADNVNLAARETLISHDDASVLRQLLMGLSMHSLTIPAEVLRQIWPTYGPNIRAVREACSGRTSTPTGALLRAICARAMFTKEKAKVQRFCAVMVSGTTSSHTERVAIKLRDTILVDWRSGTNRPIVSARYMKIQTALSHFIAGTCPQKLHPTETEIFEIARPPILNRLYEQMKEMTAKRLREHRTMKSAKNAQAAAHSPKALVLIDLFRKHGKMTTQQMMEKTGWSIASIGSLRDALRRSGVLGKSDAKNPYYNLLQP